ncbi:hypothetical protein LguiA_016830 [Lonicera macranthoides]
MGNVFQHGSKSKSDASSSSTTNSNNNNSNSSRSSSRRGRALSSSSSSSTHDSSSFHHSNSNNNKEQSPQPPQVISGTLKPQTSLRTNPSSTAPTTSSSIGNVNTRNNTKKKKYDYIPDHFSTLDQVTAALRASDLESSNLIIGIDFTKSNEWTGKVSFQNQSLHAIGSTPAAQNPYEKAISIIGKTLAPFDEDNLIPCFGFGDVTTHDQEVFSFHSDHSPCNGFEEVLACYRKLVPKLQLSGPTSYGAVVDAAVDVVERSGGQYHVLIIIADGQVTRSVNTSDKELSPQEENTINSIVNASLYPLSIVLVGVGDGPWEDMKNFDDKIPAREFDNFQFVNFTEIMCKNATPSEKETAFALAALMEIPIQYKAAVELGLLGRVTGKAKIIVARPPPFTRGAAITSRQSSNLPSPSPSRPPLQDKENQVCPICWSNGKDMAFGCGHMACRECGERLSNCPICRQRISTRLRLYTG